MGWIPSARDGRCGRSAPAPGWRWDLPGLRGEDADSDKGISTTARPPCSGLGAPRVTSRPTSMIRGDVRRRFGAWVSFAGRSTGAPDVQAYRLPAGGSACPTMVRVVPCKCVQLRPGTGSPPSTPSSIPRAAVVQKPAAGMGQRAYRPKPAGLDADRHMARIALVGGGEHGAKPCCRACCGPPATGQRTWCGAARMGPRPHLPMRRTAVLVQTYAARLRWTTQTFVIIAVKPLRCRPWSVTRL